MSVKVCVFFVDYVCSALWAVSLWSIGWVTTLCVCAYRGQRFPKDMSLAALHQAECLLAPGHRGIGWLDGWLKKGHAHHINSPSLCHLRGCVALQRWSRVVLIHGLEQALACCTQLAALPLALAPKLFQSVIKVHSVSDGWAHSGHGTRKWKESVTQDLSASYAHALVHTRIHALCSYT